ncbi:MAG: molecular chaperone HtpG [Verrucomicrobia bacterium]|nr:molecular chaperone HtpG [Verrucomicrobiota bacterium]MCH8526534.1 molecular chaperone HtpG [Kiritimatiellia bacterium]
MSTQTKTFKTEVSQLLDLVIHSLYSNKEIFLRELVSNASDAIDRARFEALSNSDLHEPEGGWRIKLVPNKDENTLTIIDNGIGMNEVELETNIGTIANSGTKAFLKQLKEAEAKDRPELIGQFGVGFYASFMVAEKVEILTRRAGETQAWHWTSTGDGTYEIEESAREQHGTTITLHLRKEEDEDGAEDFTAEYKLREIVKKYSDYIAFPVVMDVKRSEKDEEASKEGEDPVYKDVIKEETLNSMKAIWTRPKSEVTEEEYHTFYKAAFHDWEEPRNIIHWSAEGTTEFKGLVFIPKKAPFDLFYNDEAKGLHLYVKRVFIMNDCKELVPGYLRFVKGVVDSADLSLNVSREILQNNPLVRRIGKNVVSKVLSTLKDLQEKDTEAYEDFWKEFGKVVKEGMHTDHANKDKISHLLRFESSKTEPGKTVSLKDYLDRMQPDQKEIYYLTGESRAVVENSPLLEAFKARNLEVLFLTDTIDEWVIPALDTYEEKPLKGIHRGDVNLDSEEEQKEKETKLNEAKETYASVLEALKKGLGDKIKEVRFSKRLTDSAAVLVSDDSGIDANMERMMKAMGQVVPVAPRILELNPSHPVLTKLKTMVEANAEDPEITEYAELLRDQAVLTEGGDLENPARFAQQISKLMAK